MSEEYMNKERLIETINYYLLSPGNAQLDDNWADRAQTAREGQIAWAKFEEEYELIHKPKYKVGQNETTEKLIELGNAYNKEKVSSLKFIYEDGDMNLYRGKDIWLIFRKGFIIFTTKFCLKDSLLFKTLYEMCLLYE